MQKRDIFTAIPRIAAHNFTDYSPKSVRAEKSEKAGGLRVVVSHASGGGGLWYVLSRSRRCGVIL
jgi:hypothetical protein